MTPNGATFGTAGFAEDVDARCVTPYVAAMRTTLSIDDDVLDRIRAIADHENRSVGAVISDLVRKILEQPSSGLETRNGFPILPRRGALVTLQMVNAARDAD